MSDLFEWKTQDAAKPKREDASLPLAHRMRPESIEEVIGQDRILEKGKPLRNWIENDRVPSLIFWGPPGCGKTTLARIVANKTQANYESMSAVMSGVKTIKEIVDRAKHSRAMSNRKTILFVDEIHRFNKAQQDALLPHVEEGVVTLIGATTENPSFEINSALLSRCRVIRLDRLNESALSRVIQRALDDQKTGLKEILPLSQDAVDWMASFSEGDARRALTLLETARLAVIALPEKPPGEIDKEKIKSILESALDRQPLAYDKGGEEHYNVISAFIKSLRDSDPHAGLYYLARMIECGEDPKFIARRLIVFASEDIGNADPFALTVATSAFQAVQYVGLPECRINLAQAVTFLACANKSNASYKGIEDALSTVRETGALPVPMHLRNAVTGLMKKEGYGNGYQYAHSKDSHVKQSHLPEKLKGKRFYSPRPIGKEKILKERLDRMNSDFE